MCAFDVRLGGFLMQAVKAYRAYYNDGLFVPYEQVVIPKGSQAIVTIIDFPIETAQKPDRPDSVSRRQIEAMHRFREEVSSNDEPVPEFERVTLREGAV